MLGDPLEKGSLSAVTARLEKTGLELLGAVCHHWGRGEGSQQREAKTSCGKDKGPGDTVGASRSVVPDGSSPPQPAHLPGL